MSRNESVRILISLPGMPLTEDVLRLVETLATTAQIQALLRERKGEEGVRITAEKKEELVRRNLREAVEARAIDESQVFDLIRDAEENGSQHIFYFRCSKKYGATFILDSVCEKLWGKDWRSKMAFPRHELAVNDFVYADARPWNPDKKPRDWVVKIYGQEVQPRFLGETYEDNQTVLIKKYAIENRRRVLLAKWNAPDILELRVPADESRKRVDAWVGRLWNMLKDGVDRAQFKEWDLSVARRKLISKADENEKIYTFRDTVLVDPYSTAASFQPHAPQGHLFASIYAKDAIQGLLNADSQCSRVAVTWLAGDGVLTRDLRTSIGVQKTNEVIIGEHCAARDIDYVTEQLRLFGREAS